jgi:GT2 family glycosyltransferase
VSRELFLRAGRFDEKYWLYTEDMAFCRSCHKLGFFAYIVRDYTLYHKKTVISDAQFELIAQNLSHYFSCRRHSVPYLCYLFLTELTGLSPVGRAKKLIKKLKADNQ